jgi:predicted PurR-regulated permease PerM
MEKFVTIILYLLLFTFFSLIIVKYVPILIAQSEDIIEKTMDFISGSSNSSSSVQNYIISTLQGVDFNSYIKSGFDITLKFAQNVGKWSINIFISVMLSLFFMLGKKEVISFLKRFENSKIAPLCRYFAIFVNNFLNTFGKVLQAQITIAVVNTIISEVMLFLFHFPQLVALGFMIFILSLIPVAGVIVSLFPLCIIALKIGGITKVIYVIIMIAIIHIIESYILNPNLMAAKVKLPIFITFVILIISEHFLGVWGLLIGIPLFMFVLDLLNVSANEQNIKR